MLDQVKCTKFQVEIHSLRDQKYKDLGRNMRRQMRSTKCQVKYAWSGQKYQVLGRYMRGQFKGTNSYMEIKASMSKSKVSSSIEIHTRPDQRYQAIGSYMQGQIKRTVIGNYRHGYIKRTMSDVGILAWPDKKTIPRLIHDGQLPSHKQGYMHGHIKVTKSQIEIHVWPYRRYQVLGRDSCQIKDL